MVSFELGVPSEVLSLVNFALADVVLVALVMLLTSRIAGLINYYKLTAGETVSLKTCRLPHVGGGIVMRSGYTRTFLIFLRASIIVAICVSNFGLQGRSTTRRERKMVTVRKPGPVYGIEQETLFEATEVRMRCAKPVGDELKFGAVYDGKCAEDSYEFVYVKTLSLKYEEYTHTIGKCESDMPFPGIPVTVLRCENSDFSCDGPYDEGPKEIHYETCFGVIYTNNSAYACPASGFDLSVPQKEQTKMCRKMGAVRRDVERWIDIFEYTSDDFLTSIFGAAYGTEHRAIVKVPAGEKIVTIVTLSWLIPSLWQLILVSGLAVWYAALVWSGARPIANDEVALTQMLKRNLQPINDLTLKPREISWV